MNSTLVKVLDIQAKPTVKSAIKARIIICFTISV